MELIERIQRFKRTFDEPEDPYLPWYRKKKNLMILTIAIVLVLGVVGLFFGGFFAGMSANKSKEDLTEPQARVILPPVEWVGTCPKTTGVCSSSFKSNPPLLLVSLDGFFPSLMDRGLTPTIKKIARCGSHAPYMFSVFPTKTFPNHFSQVTGLHPSSHGIIDNSFYDPIKKKLFKVGTSESLNPDWWLKEPIWITAIKQGKKSACYYWPGSEVKFDGVLPTHNKKYNSRISFNSRVDQVLKWLDLPPSSRPDVITLYVNKPDHALHSSGFISKELDEALIEVNAMIERLFSGLQQRNLVNCVNVVITSDHGMAQANCNHIIDIQNDINVNENYITVGTYGRIRPKGKRNATVVDQIVSKLRCKDSHMRIYPKEQLPVRLHFAESPRIEPIFIDLDAGWTLISRHLQRESDRGICSNGKHGYDNLFPEMRALFIAHGPSFKKNYTAMPFLNVELYEMYNELIGTTPNPNNGTRGSLHHIMVSPKYLPKQKEPESPPVAYVPVEENVYNDRLLASTCICPEAKKQTNVDDISETKNMHLPFGTPYSVEDNNEFNLLLNNDYINGFSLKYKFPVWSSFTLMEKKELKDAHINSCWNGDVRIPDNRSPTCDDFKRVKTNNAFVPKSLYNPGFSNPPHRDQGMHITNVILKSVNHTNIIEEPFYGILNTWVSRYGPLNVVTGPAFDIFATGIKPDDGEFMNLYNRKGPTLISTHIFYVITWCVSKVDSLKNCDPSKLQAQGFLLPNHPFPINCESARLVIIKNVARVIDIENLTGLSFYKKLPIYDAIRLRTMMPDAHLFTNT